MPNNLKLILHNGQTLIEGMVLGLGPNLIGGAPYHVNRTCREHVIRTRHILVGGYSLETIQGLA